MYVLLLYIPSVCLLFSCKVLLGPLILRTKKLLGACNNAICQECVWREFCDQLLDEFKTI